MRKNFLLLFQNIIEIVKKTVILLTIPNREGYRCLEVKNVSELFKGRMSKHDGGIYCLNCLYSFRTENKLESHKKSI